MQTPMLSPKVVQSNISQWHKTFSLKKNLKSKIFVNFFKFDQKNMNFQKSKNITLAFFLNAASDVFFLNNLYFFIKLEKVYIAFFPTFSKLNIFGNSQKLILSKVLKYFLMKITTWTIQTPRTSVKFITLNISRWKETLFERIGF